MGPEESSLRFVTQLGRAAVSSMLQDLHIVCPSVSVRLVRPRHCLDYHPLTIVVTTTATAILGNISASNATDEEPLLAGGVGQRWLSWVVVWLYILVLAIEGHPRHS